VENWTSNLEFFKSFLPHIYTREKTQGKDCISQGFPNFLWSRTTFGTPWKNVFIAEETI